MHWGALPGRDSVPTATVDSGAVVTVDYAQHGANMLEAPLRAILRLTVLPRDTARRAS